MRPPRRRKTRRANDRADEGAAPEEEAEGQAAQAAPPRGARGRRQEARPQALAPPAGGGVQRGDEPQRGHRRPREPDAQAPRDRLVRHARSIEGDKIRPSLEARSDMSLLALAATALLAAAAAPAAPAARPADHVFILMLDGTRPDFLRRARAPVIHALAAQGTTFLQAE